MFFRVMRVSTRVGVSTASSIEQSVMAFGRRRGRGCDFVGGCSSFGGGRGFYGDRQIVGDNGPRQCKHCGRNNHISEKCWENFGRP